MGRKIAFVFLTLSVCISALSVAFSVRNAPEARTVISDETNAITTVSEKLTGYILKEYEGRLAVFEAGSDAPFKEFDVPVRLLSDYDREILKEGIYAKGESEIRTLIEDYTS